MSIQRAARGVRVAAQSAYLVGRLRGSGSAKLVPVQELASALQPSGQVAVPGSAPAATVVASGTGISVGYAGVTYTVTNTGVLSNVAGSGIGVSGATGNVTISNTGVLSVAGTSNRLTASAATGAITLDISASYVGQASITTLGTITTGAWHGTFVGVAYGGTGADLSATGGAGKVVKQVSAGAAFTVGRLDQSDLTNTALTVGTLPAGTAGQIAYVTDGAASQAWGATIAAGGSTPYLVWYNGANWTVLGS